eukprot:scaffold32689_cov19-Tisochrysis_lutea.AAC.1
MVRSAKHCGVAYEMLHKQCLACELEPLRVLLRMPRMRAGALQGAYECASSYDMALHTCSLAFCVLHP